MQKTSKQREKVSFRLSGQVSGGVVEQRHSRGGHRAIYLHLRAYWSWSETDGCCKVRRPGVHVCDGLQVSPARTVVPSSPWEVDRRKDEARPDSPGNCKYSLSPCLSIRHTLSVLATAWVVVRLSYRKRLSGLWRSLKICLRLIKSYICAYKIC